MKQMSWLFAAFALFAVTVALFAPAVSFSLVNFDDPVFVTHNPIVADGFSWRAIPRAFTELHGDRLMYTPLLWLSFLADSAFFGATPVEPWGFHLSNVLLHAANAVLLFFILRLCTRRTLPALLAAAFWALHPLRVESVAWVTERKDTLSSLFAFASILFYLKAFSPWERGRPARDGGSGSKPPPAFHFSLFTFHCDKGCLRLALASFVAGLLSKPMLVTLPFLLLLLDFWPLGRYSLRDAPRVLPRLVLEKWLWFLLALVVSVFTRILQTEAVFGYSLLHRLYWLPSNYFFYFAKSFCPIALIPMTPGLSVAPLFVAGVMAFFLALAALAVRLLRRCPGFAVGLAAFAGLLFPVSGIIFIGNYPVADRYSYLPAIGLSLALAALFDCLCPPLPPSRTLDGRNPETGICPPRLRFSLFALLFAAGLLALAAVTARILPVWKNSEALYTRISAFLPDHVGVLHYRFAQAFFVRGNREEAVDLANRLYAPGHLDARRFFPKLLVLSQTESSRKALDLFRENPPDESRSHMGDTLHLALAVLAADVGDSEDAVRHVKLANAPDLPGTLSTDAFHATAAWVFWRLGLDDRALDSLRRISTLADATALTPETLLRPCASVWHDGLRRQALPTLLQLACEAPSNPALLNNIAWLLATTPDSPANPDDVLAIARQAMALSPKNPVIGDTLAVALAFAGCFDEAISLDSAVAAFLRSSSAPEAPSMLANVEKRLDLFRQHRPYTESNSSTLLLFAH